jgi:hypothetical protein
LAAAFGKKGYRVLTDDVCAVKIGDDEIPYIIPGFPSIKLWREVAERFGESVAELERINKEFEKYRVGIETRYSRETSVLNELYVLDSRDSEIIEMKRINDTEKLDVLIRNTYRYRFLKGQGKEAVHFKQCTSIAGKISVFRVLRPKTGFMLDELVSAIEENIGKV